MTENTNLDDVMALEEADPGKMLGAIEGFSRQCADALRLGREVAEVPRVEGLKGMAYVGMGGSAIGGDILRVLLEDAAQVPISVHRSYRLPVMMGSDHLAVFASYSGETEETLSALEDAVYMGCRVLAITSGGTLGEKARRHRFPLITIPGGLQPRAALGFLSLTAAAVLEKAGLLHGFVKVAHETVSSLQEKGEEWGRLSPASRNFAKRMAMRLEGKIPVIYGAGDLMGVAAYRWKCQFNENSKQPAFCHVLPEMNHNEIVGWNEAGEFSRRVEAIFLAEEAEATRINRRVEITSEILQDKLGGVSVIYVGGATRTERLFSAIHLGDFVSAYLAVLNGVDPTPVENIALLKKRMAEEGDTPAPRNE